MTQETKKIRFQNISTVITAVLRDGKNVMLKPGGIAQLTEQDVQDTKDQHASYDKNPFDTGLVKEIPDGASEHPDVIKKGKTMRSDEARKVLSEYTIDDATAAIREITDMSGVTVLQEILGELEQSMDASRHAALGEVVDEKASWIANKSKKLKNRYANLSS